MTAATQTEPAGDQSVIAAFQQLVADKTPYVWGGMSKAGADCSGAVKWAFAQAGFNFGARTALSQSALGAGVPLSGANKLANAKPGDVLFFQEDGSSVIDHEALYAGNGQDYEESTPGQVAHLIPVDVGHLVSIRQFITNTDKAGAGINGTAQNVTAPSSTSSSSGSSSSSWAAIGMKILFVAGGAGLVVFGAYKTAAPA